MVLKNSDDSSSSKITHQVHIDAEYNSDLDYFDFDSDMDPWTISRVMSKVLRWIATNLLIDTTFVGTLVT